MKRNYLTKEGLDHLREKLDNMTHKYFASCNHLRSMEPKEKFEYIISHNELNNLRKYEESINDISKIINNARIITKAVANGSISLGSRVKLLFRRKAYDYMIVDSVEADPSAHKISVNSPLGEALLGHKALEKISIKTPTGKLANYRVLSIG